MTDRPTAQELADKVLPYIVAPLISIADTAADAVAELVRRAEEAETQRKRVPEDGPGNPETYWLRQKLNASITHLRDIEDFYRLRGGTLTSYNMNRADRARDIYEQITEDFFNGKINTPTMRERAEEADRLREAVLACIGDAEGREAVQRHRGLELTRGQVMLLAAALSERDP